MLLILALILALLSLLWLWNLAVIVVAAACEATASVLGIRYTRLRRTRDGVETLVDRTASVITPILAGVVLLGAFAFVESHARRRSCRWRPPATASSP